MAVKDITTDAMAILFASSIIGWQLRVGVAGLLCGCCGDLVCVRMGKGRLVIRCKQCGKGIYFRSEGG